MSDLIDRQAAIEAIEQMQMPIMRSEFPEEQFVFTGMSEALQAIKDLPSAQPERDTPIKPIETTDRAWGIPHRQAVCPNCDYYLGNVAFLGDYKGKRITYCETCGQAIDWEGWDFDE